MTVTAFASAADLRQHYDRVKSKFFPCRQAGFAHTDYRWLLKPEPLPEVKIVLFDPPIERGAHNVPQAPPVDDETELLVLKIYQHIVASTTRPTIRFIQATVAACYNIRLSDLSAKGRTVDLIVPRHAAMFLCRVLTNRSYPTIGRAFGGRDHSTVIHACAKFGKLQAYIIGLRHGQTLRLST